MIDPSKEENVIYNLCQWISYHYIAMLTEKKYVTLFYFTIQCFTSNSFYFIILLTLDLETGSHKQVVFIV